MSERRTRDYLLEISRSRANQWLPDDSKFPEPDPEEDEEDEEPEPELELKKLKPKPKPKGRKVPLPRQSRSTPSVLSEQHRSSSRHASPFREKQSHPRGLNYRPDNQQRKRDRFPRMPLQLSAAAEERLEQDANLEERRKFFGRIHYDDVSSELDGEFPWPWGSDDEMSPERLLGDQLEAFDDVRVDERVFVSVDRYRLVGVERQIVNIKVSGRREDRVQTALKRVEGAVQEIESNCSYTERALLLEPPLVEITGVRVDDRPSLIGEPCKRAPKELIGTVAAPLIDFGEPITMMGDADERRSQRAENADRRRDALKSSLIVVHAMRKHIRLRVQIGALQLLQYKTSDELKNGLHDWSRFCSMLSKLRARWRVAPDSFSDREIEALRHRFRLGVLPQPALILLVAFDCGRGNTAVLERQYLPVAKNECNTVDSWYDDERTCIDTATLYLDKNIGLRTTLTARNPISPGDLSPRLKKFARSIMLASTDPPVATINKSSNSRIRWCTQSTVFPYEVDGVTLELRRNADIPSQQPVAPKQPEKFSRDRKPKPTGSRFAQPNRFGDVDMDEDEDEEMGSSETEVETPSMTPSETSCETPEKYWSIAAYKPVWDQTFANQGSIGVGLKPNWEPVLETFFPEGLDGFSDTIEKIRQGLADAVESTAAAGIRDQLAAPDVRHLGELGDANSLSEDTVSQSSMLGLPGDTRSVVESNDNGKEEGIVVTSSHETEREYTMAVDGDEDDDDDGAEW